MGLNWNNSTKEVRELESFNCDRCNKCVDDVLEMQEMMHWTNTGGYSSVFGDGVTVEIVLCQHCIEEALGEYMTMEDKYKNE